jgi:hypothetical protein
VAATNDFSYDPRRGPRDRALRVGDKERDAVSEILQQRHLEGRLDSEEFQARVERCMAAKTYAELDELVADFPHESGEQLRVQLAPERRPWPLVLPLLPVALIVALVLVGHHAWLAVPLLLVLVLRPLTWHGRGSGHARGPWACGPRGMTRV